MEIVILIGSIGLLVMLALSLWRLLRDDDSSSGDDDDDDDTGDDNESGTTESN